MKKYMLMAIILIATIILGSGAYIINAQTTTSESTTTTTQATTTTTTLATTTTTEDDDDTKPAKENKSRGEERRSEVANAVHELLSVADRVGGIGEQVRVIAQAQNQNQEQIEDSVEKIEKQNKLTTFLIGPNHGEINKAAKLTVKNEEQIVELKALQTTMTDQTEIQKTTEQIQTLEKANLEVKTTLETAQKTFSLFGWLRKLFAD